MLPDGRARLIAAAHALYPANPVFMADGTAPEERQAGAPRGAAKKPKPVSLERQVARRVTSAVGNPGPSAGGSEAVRRGSVLRLGDGEEVFVGKQVGLGQDKILFDVADSPDLVFQRYTDVALRQEPSLERRIRTLIAKPPPDWRSSDGHVTFAWPIDVVLGREEGFVGFITPKIDTAHTAVLPVTPRILSSTRDPKRSSGISDATWSTDITWHYVLTGCRLFPACSSVAQNSRRVSRVPRSTGPLGT